MPPIEIRGVWLTTTDSQVLRLQENIVEAMNFLAETGFNVVFPVVWNQAVTLFPSKTMRQNFGIEIDPLSLGRDPLQEVVDAAHSVGLKVIPWFEYGFASSYNLNGGMLLAKKPEWKARDRTGKLLNKNGFEWMNALNPEVQEFLLNMVLEVVQNYDVDGIQGDDRFPALPCEGGYDSMTVERYVRQFGKNPPQNPQDKQWLQWRADILTQFWAGLYRDVKVVNPNLLVSVSPNIYDWTFKEYLQDTPTWLQQGIVDIIHPQIYRRDFSSYKSIVDRLLKEQFTDKVLAKFAPGILMKVGSYRITADDLVRIIEYNRTCGISGEVLFFYEGLRDNNNELGKVLRNKCYGKSAIFPSLSYLNQGAGKNSTPPFWQKILKLLN
jgi:uncharacterized lipoprotein YddW (UPF0748 family)